jgi:hypothetical protein
VEVGADRVIKRLKDLETKVHKLTDEVNEMELRIDAFQTIREEGGVSLWTN